MAKHPRHIEGFNGSLEQLAKSVGNMTYDQTALFIEKLADDIMEQANADSKNQRTKLAHELYSTASELYKAADKMNNAWEICKPYM